MRCIIQRVSRASVTVNGSKVTEINRGLMVLVGVSTSDTKKEAEYVAKKILTSRLFENQAGKAWTESVESLGLQVLCVSQFTLYGSVTGGRKPDFHHAMKTDAAKVFYSDFLATLKSLHGSEKVVDGVFGEHMHVELVNDGPVTLIVEKESMEENHHAAASED